MKMKWKKCTTVQEHSGKNLHKSLRFLFFIAQLCGFFPITGVLASAATGIGFTWISLRVLSSLLTGFGGAFVTFGHIRDMAIHGGYDQFQMNGIVFYSCGVASCLIFVKMARQWAEITKKWHETEEAMIHYGWPKNLDMRFKIISAVFLSLEVTEHVMIQANKLIVATKCKGSFLAGFEHFCVNMSFPHIFNMLPYDPWFGVILQLINSRMAFSWTFLDLFIILMSCALASRFRQVNEKILYLRNMKAQSVRSWEVIREDYNRLCRLCQYLNEKMSWMIIVSFTTNLYFIVFQVYGSINLQETALERIYYFISLGLLILRIVSVSLYGSWVHEESRKPMTVLSSASHEIYNKEIERLIERIKYGACAFHGKNLFKITKDLILKIIGALVTYELVIIQLNRNNLKDSDEPSRNSIC